MSLQGADILGGWRERVLAARAAGASLLLHGARSKDFLGEVRCGEPLDLRAFSGISAYEPAELVVTARCGTPLSQLESTLATHGQFLGFEPPAFGADPTIGGIVASGLSGPRRLQVGAARDFVLGATLLGADGELARFGGQVMKNVAGFDVARLLCGSLGIFGIITEVSLKVLPQPRAEATVQFEVSAGEAIGLFNRLCARPLPISAAAWCAGTARVRLSGASAAVAAALREIGGEPLAAVEAGSFWDSLRHGTHPHLRADRLWRISVPSDAPELDLPGEPLIDWCGALRWYSGDYDAAMLRRAASVVGGTAQCWRGPVQGPRLHPLSPAAHALHRRLKGALDPARVFNRGRLLADL
jgi:glycolate oxidase FAD binding subunit